MLLVHGNTDIIRVVTGSAADLRVHRSSIRVDAGTPPVVQPIDTALNGPVAAITTATTTTILDATGITSGHVLNVKILSLYNGHATQATTVRVEHNDGTNTAILANVNLLAGELLLFTQGGVWLHYDTNGGVYQAGISQVGIQDFTASGTYTPTAGTKYAIVVATGSGGGGGGSDTSAGGSGDVGVGGGGGGGETRIGFFTAAQLTASVSITINATGTAGSATNGTAGGNGGTAVFGSLITANGGTGGTGSGATTQDSQSIAGGAGGTGGSGGTFAVDGGDGTSGLAFSVDGTTDTSSGLGGNGGSSFWGGGGKGGNTASVTLTNAANVAGIAGKARGSGGGGAVTTNSTTGAAGGAGKVGGITVYEFI